MTDLFTLACAIAKKEVTMPDPLQDLYAVISEMAKRPVMGRPIKESRLLLERAATDFYDIVTTPYETSPAYAQMLADAAVALTMLSKQVQSVSGDVEDELYEMKNI